MKAIKLRPKISNVTLRVCETTVVHAPPRIETLEKRAYLSASFSGPVNFPGINSPTAIASADFNGDGAPDVVVAGAAPGSGIAALGVYLQKSGSFGVPTLFPISGTPAGLAAGDFAGNGKQSVGVIDSTTNELDVFLNDGHGNFSPGAGASLGGAPGDTGLVSADFNGDGKDDIAAVDSIDNEVIVEFSRGDGSFSPAGDISVPSPIKVVPADFNGDKLPDLAILSSNGSVYVSLNQGNGVFNGPTAYALGLSNAVPVSIVAGGSNLNSNPNIAVVASSTTGGAGMVSVLLNNGDGTFGAASSVAATPANPLSIMSGNFTGSGNADLAVIDAAGGLTVIPGLAGGTFGAPQSVFTTQLSPGSGAVAADFNGDGPSDIAYLDPAKGGFSTLINTSVSPNSPLHPSLSGRLPVATLVASSKIAPIAQTVRLTNTGSTSIVGPVTVNFFLSANNTSTSGGIPVGLPITRRVNLRPRASIPFPIVIRSLPADATGTFYLLAQATDPNGATAIGATAGTISPQAPFVDLSGTIVSVPARAIGGRSVFANVLVTENGNIAVTPNLTSELFASATGILDANSIDLGPVTRRVAIPPKGRVLLSLTVPLPKLPAGPYTIFVQLDPNNSFNDTDLTNNVLQSVKMVSVI